MTERRSDRCALTLAAGAVLAVSAGFAQNGTSQRPIARSLASPYFSSADYWNVLLIDVDSKQFVDLPFDVLPTRLQSQMYNYLAFSLQSECHPQERGKPHRPNQVDVRAFAASNGREHDLLEYRWAPKGQVVRLVAGLNAMRIDIRVSGLEANRAVDEFGQDLSARVHGFVEGLLRLRGIDRNGQSFTIDLPWPEKLTQGEMFSSNAKKDLNRMGMWHERVDVQVKQATVSIFISKKIEQLVGYRDGSKWFSDEFRAKVHDLAARQGKSPTIEKQEDD